MDREAAMAGFGCNWDTLVNQAHNQQRGKTSRGAETAVGELNTSAKLPPLLLRLCSPFMTCPYTWFL